MLSQLVFALETCFVNLGLPFNENYVCMYVLIITGVQASGEIIDRLLRQCCFVWSKIVGPHSSGNFNDWPLKLKAGSKMWVVVIRMLFNQMNWALYEILSTQNTSMYVCMYVCIYLFYCWSTMPMSSLIPFEWFIPYSGFCYLVIDHKRLRNQIWRENNQWRTRLRLSATLSGFINPILMSSMIYLNWNCH